jgi:pilus assembly protein CpaC
MKPGTVTRKIGLMGLVIALSVCQTFSFECRGQGPPQIILETTSVQNVNLSVGRSLVIQSAEPIKRVSLVAPEIADAMVLTPHQVYLMGKSPGITNLTLWGADNKVTAVLDIEISPDISRLKETLHTILPEEMEVKVTATHDHLTLSGTVSSATNLSQVMSAAGPYAPLGEDKKPKIVNLLEVAGIHQVMLEVRVSEISRSLLKRLGFNFGYVSGSGHNFGFSLLNQLTSLSPTGSPSVGVGASDTVNGIIRFLAGGATWTVFIDALKEDGLLKVLAEPTLITLSGKTANFLAGGEFPIPVPQSSLGGGTTITIEYKPFGVGLNFTPTVLSNKKISMQVAPEVSDLDFSNAVTTSGFVVPAITTRRVSTVIELADGQSFAIAGLLKDDVREVVSKFPILGDIPILGALFRSSSFRKNETELLVIVTAHLVKPLDRGRQPLPTDQYIEPDDFEFYLLGDLEGRGVKARSRKEGGLDGEFGYLLPR